MVVPLRFERSPGFQIIIHQHPYPAKLFHVFSKKLQLVGDNTCVPEFEKYRIAAIKVFLLSTNKTVLPRIIPRFSARVGHFSCVLSIQIITVIDIVLDHRAVHECQ